MTLREMTTKEMETLVRSLVISKEDNDTFDMMVSVIEGLTDLEKVYLIGMMSGMLAGHIEDSAKNAGVTVEEFWPPNGD
jgi:hypothetical protein